MIDIQDLKNASESYANLIRQYVKDNSFLWRKLPYYCLMADGKSGYSDTYHTCYTTGCFQLGGFGSNPNNFVFVDCSNSTIVSFYTHKQLASDNAIISIPFNEYDVNKILNSLKKQASQPESHYIRPPNGDSNWRDKIMMEKNLYD